MRVSSRSLPNSVSDHRIYVYYTQDGNAGQPAVLHRFPVNGNVMDTSIGAETPILLVPDFAENHNGGILLFGPDAYLYLRGPQVEELLHRFPNVVLHVAGHGLEHRITPQPDPQRRSGGYWEVATGSPLDFPMQSRLLEIADNEDGTVPIF